MTPMSFYAYRFVVFGNGQFPLDMLRRDRCVPDTPDDCVRAFQQSGERYVGLVGFAPRGVGYIPSLDSWSEAGWSIHGPIRAITF
jgi:hypothetical protein